MKSADSAVIVAAYCLAAPARRVVNGKGDTNGRIPSQFGQIPRHFCCPPPLGDLDFRPL